jgi:hypothetical protein
VVHIATLSLLSTVAQCISLLVPNDGTIQILQSRSPFTSFGRKFVTQLYRHGNESNGEDAYIFWYASMLLSAISMVIAAMIPLGPQLYFPPQRVYTLKSVETAAKELGADPILAETTMRERKANVIGLVGSSLLGILLFDYSTKVVMLGYSSISLEIADLPILPATLRATTIFSNMRRRLYALKQAQSPNQTYLPSNWAAYQITVRVPFASTLIRIFPAVGTRFPSITEPQTIAPFHPLYLARSTPPWIKLLIQLAKANRNILLAEVVLSFLCAFPPYAPIFFLKRFIAWLESDPRRTGRPEAGGVLASFIMPITGIEGFSFERESDGWAWVYCAGIFGTTLLHHCGALHCFGFSRW